MFLVSTNADEEKPPFNKSEMFTLSLKLSIFTFMLLCILGGRFSHIKAGKHSADHTMV
jgi:hypothetical protein